MKLSLPQLEADLLRVAKILHGKSAGQDHENCIRSLMFHERLRNGRVCEAGDAIPELERQRGRAFGGRQKAVFRRRGEHRYKVADGPRWGDAREPSSRRWGI